MRAVCISDTHCRHGEVKVPDGDVLIFAGDACLEGTLAELLDFTTWLHDLPHKEKIVVAGNHDWCLTNKWGVRRAAENIIAEAGAWYLRDYAVTLKSGLKVYGSPWQPEFCGWAFNLPRGKPLEEVWAKIPDDTDILVTHGPPVGSLDGTGRGVEHVGDAELRERVAQLKRLKLHVFGHIHEGHGVDKISDVTSVNAALGYHLEHEPVIVEL